MDARTNKSPARPTALLAKPALLVALAGLALFPGCSLFTMAGKMFGDPLVECAFKKVARANLVDSKKSVIVLCTIPESVNSRYPAVNQRILEGVTRHLKREGIRVIDANDVLTWLDDRNGVWGGPNEIAKDFDADFIIHIDLTEFTHKAENSPGLYQGRTQGQVNAYKVSKDGKTKRADSVFTTEYSSEFPPNAPMSANQASGEIFLHKYEKRISDELARMFYDHPAGDEIP